MTRRAPPALLLDRGAAAPAGKPGRREARRELRREAILDVAQQSFLEQGYAATTMSAISSRLGGSKATLWHHFPSKDLLFAAVLERATEAFRARVAMLLAPGEDVERSLRAFAGQFVERICSPEAIALYRLVVAEARRFPETGRIFFERAPARTRATLAAFLEDAMARGALKQGDAAAAARQFLALCLAGCHQQLVLGLTARAEADAMAEDAGRAVDLFLAAMRR